MMKHSPHENAMVGIKNPQPNNGEGIQAHRIKNLERGEASDLVTGAACPAGNSWDERAERKKTWRKRKMILSLSSVFLLVVAVILVVLFLTSGNDESNPSEQRAIPPVAPTPVSSTPTAAGPGAVHPTAAPTEGDATIRAPQPTPAPSSAWIQVGQAMEGIDLAFQPDLEEVDDVRRFTRSLSLSRDGTTVAANFYEIYPDKLSPNLDSNLFVRTFRYINDTVGWSQIGQDFDYGSSVSVSDDGDTFTLGDTGRARLQVFQYDSEADLWVQWGQDMNSDAEQLTTQLFGGAVSISGDSTTVAVGAEQADIETINDGLVRVYRYNNTAKAWSQIGQDIVGEGRGDDSGSSVSLNWDGSVVAIGAPGNDGGDFDTPFSSSLRGHVRIFRYVEITDKWEQLGQDVDGKGRYDSVGTSVSLSRDGKVFATSAPGAPAGLSCVFKPGTVRVFFYDSIVSRWVQLGQDIDGEDCGDETESVALSGQGDVVVVGAHLNDGSSSDFRANHGHVRVFRFDHDTQMWTLIGPEMEGPAGSRFGQAVSIDSTGNTVAIGSNGTVGVYQLSL